MRFVGRDLYEAFFKGYTIKQWGMHPSELPAAILKRLPVRFNYDDNYFFHKYQGMPENGYTAMIEKILDHPSITVKLETVFDRKMGEAFDHVFYSGAIDHFFGCRLGRLAYRTLDFKQEYRDTQFQDCGTVNYCDADVPYTRVVEHKHFWPEQNYSKTVISFEYSRECGPGDKPYYPIRLNKDNLLYEQYVEMAKQEPNVSFVGRLGTYRYLDMDVAIKEAMQAAKATLESIESRVPIPTFFVDTETPHSKS